MISWLMYGFEELVLRTFVVVQSLLLWTFAGISSGAMNVPSVRRLLDRFSPPHSTAGSPDPASAGVTSGRYPGRKWRDLDTKSEGILMHASGLTPIFLEATPKIFFIVIAGWYCWKSFGDADIWPAGCPQPPTRKPANRNARSVRGCLVEASLSAVVWVYTAKGVTSSPTAWEMLALFIVLSSTLRGAKAGFYHVVHADFAERAVDLIVHRNGDRVRPDGTVSLNLHSVDLFEYADMAALSRIYVTALVVIVWAFIMELVHLVLVESKWTLLAALVVFLCPVFLYMYFRVSFRQTRELLHRPKLQDISGTRPSYMVVRFFLLLSGLAYAGSLCFSPGPYLWKGGLIVTHNARLLNLLVSLRGRNEGRVDAAAASAQHVREQ
ncbi:unnamed protein product [Scytosiphon promiscuus]